MKLQGIIETSLYTDDLKAMRHFYESILGLACIISTENQHVFFKINNSILLIFDRAYTIDQTASVNGNVIPPHATKGDGHIAFEAPNGEFENCKNDIIAKGVEIESEVNWPGGVRSFYFRDCDHNSIEITEYNFWKTWLERDG